MLLVIPLRDTLSVATNDFMPIATIGVMPVAVHDVMPPHWLWTRYCLITNDIMHVATNGVIPIAVNDVMPQHWSWKRKGRHASSAAGWRTGSRRTSDISQALQELVEHMKAMEAAELTGWITSRYRLSKVREFNVGNVDVTGETFDQGDVRERLGGIVRVEPLRREGVAYRRPSKFALNKLMDSLEFVLDDW